MLEPVFGIAVVVPIAPSWRAWSCWAVFPLHLFLKLALLLNSAVPLCPKARVGVRVGDLHYSSSIRYEIGIRNKIGGNKQVRINHNSALLEQTAIFLLSLSIIQQRFLFNFLLMSGSRKHPFFHSFFFFFQFHCLCNKTVLLEMSFVRSWYCYICMCCLDLSLKAVKQGQKSIR